MRTSLSSRKVPTAVIHDGQRAPDGRRNLTLPIYQTSAFTIPEVAHGISIISQQGEGYFYSRYDNPNVRLLEEKLSSMDGVESCVTTPNGMSALLLVVLSLGDRGSEILADRRMYHEIIEMLQALTCKTGHRLRIVDCTNSVALAEALSPDVALLLAESPTNPLQRVLNIGSIKNLLQERAPNAVFCVDNTMLTPLHQNCFALGADLTVYSTTKHIAGHGDAQGGAICGPAGLLRKVRELRSLIGLAMSPFEAWLITRGLKTLPLRLERMCRSAARVAEFLTLHPMIDRVHYTGLSSHPDRLIAERQQCSGGSVMVFEVKGGAPVARKVLEYVELFTIATTFGNLESTIYHFHTFAAPGRDLSALGENDSMVRISIGVEDPDDLVADLKAALRKASSCARGNGVPETSMGAATRRAICPPSVAGTARKVASNGVAVR